MSLLGGRCGMSLLVADVGCHYPWQMWDVTIGGRYGMSLFFSFSFRFLLFLSLQHPGEQPLDSDPHLPGREHLLLGVSDPSAERRDQTTDDTPTAPCGDEC